MIFSSYSKLSSYAGLVPWVATSDTKSYYGKITKYGPSELRTAFVQMAIGMMRVKAEQNNRFMVHYRFLKSIKGSGRSIIAIARKLTKVVWVMLMRQTQFNSNKLKINNFDEKIRAFVA